jgi:6-phosphogluconolactonase
VVAVGTSTSLKVAQDLDEIAFELAARFAEAARKEVREQGRFTVALSGGRTPEPLYRRIASTFAGGIPWKGVHLFWSDERFVPADDEASNYRMAREAMLKAIAIPEANVHRPSTGPGDDPDESARRYEERIRSFLGPSPSPSPPRFDWILLGLGEDGHVASLFEGSPALEERERLVVAVRDAPKPPPVRLTMTLPLINAGREIHFLVSGREKNAILYRVLRGSDPGLPAVRVRPERGSLYFWVDRSAAVGG